MPSARLLSNHAERNGDTLPAERGRAALLVPTVLRAYPTRSARPLIPSHVPRLVHDSFVASASTGGTTIRMIRLLIKQIPSSGSATSLFSIHYSLFPRKDTPAGEVAAPATATVTPTATATVMARATATAILKATVAATARATTPATAPVTTSATVTAPLPVPVRATAREPAPVTGTATARATAGATAPATARATARATAPVTASARAPAGALAIAPAAA
jgi:hypothetical protein